jgi:8-oxo-dGTP diphosphatase
MAGHARPRNEPCPSPQPSPRKQGEGGTAKWEGEGPAKWEGEGQTGSGSKEGRRYPDRPIVGVLAVVLRGDRVLIVRRANPPMPGRWGFPGGVLELGETVAQGAMRELFEETGVEAEAVGILTVIDTIDRDREGRVRYHYTLVAVIGHWQSGEGVPGDDADEVAWLTRAEIVEQNLLTAPALLPLIDLALQRASS